MNFRGDHVRKLSVHGSESFTLLKGALREVGGGKLVLSIINEGRACWGVI
jgi:hypothetical protein